MMTVVLFGLLFGLAVGSRYRVVALLPCEGAAFLIALAAVLVSPTSLANAAAAFGLWSVSLQLGYLARICWHRPARLRSRALVHET